MSSESMVFGGDINNNQKALTGDQYYLQSLKFALAATVILPIVGQIISLGQLFTNKKELKNATLKGYIFLSLTIFVSIAYVAAVLIFFANRPSGLPPAY